MAGDGVYRADMDGSNFTQLVAGSYDIGIAIDPDSDRLYWTNYYDREILSSYRNGSGVETVVLLHGGAPWGLAKLNETLCWGDVYGNALQCSSVTGEDVVTVYKGTSTVRHLTVVPSPTLNDLRNKNVGNPCEGQGCSHICVRTAKSSRCLCPEGLHLAEGERTCVQPH